ncbi:MAG: flagellin N-terminal helical domain-containing protein [Planctomycetota bacterium]|jgi:flagellin
MARINSNIPSLIAQHTLTRSNDDLVTRLQRLSTGLRINRGADDPAGLIVSERLRSELKGLNQAVDNSERASMVIATTEGYLAEVADLLNSVKGLIVEAANTGGLSEDEIAANQLQIDNAIDAITRISNTASFAGLQLLNGSLDYLTSGVPASAISGVSIYGAQFGTNPSMTVQVEVISSAQTASLFLSGNTAGAAGELLSSVTVEIAGNLGVQTLSFVSGTTLSDVVAAVNTVKESTGVSAALVSASDQTSGLTFNSVGYGSDEYVSVRKIGAGGDFFGTYEAKNGSATQRDEGRDVTAILNGALATGDGLNLSLNTPSLSIEMNLTAAYAQTTGQQKMFDITGGGSVFQLGPSISAVQQVGIGVQSVAASRLGGSMINGVRYFLDSLKEGQANAITAGRAEFASRVLDEAIDDVSLLRGRLGAFERNTVQTNIRALQIGVENITASESQIRDADFAEETAQLSRAQILSQAGTSVLATANALSANVLALLG